MQSRPDDDRRCVGSVGSVRSVDPRDVAFIPQNSTPSYFPTFLIFMRPMLMIDDAYTT